MLIQEKLFSKVKGNVLFVYDPVTKHPNVNRQINVTNADLNITFLFVVFILYVKRKQMQINKIQIIQPCALNKEDDVLLQTATAVVFNRENSNKMINVTILFDKASQKSFINQSLRDELNLKIQRS